MHAQPPRTLKRLLKTYGQELINDPRRTEALLRDHCGQHTREIFVLVNAQKQRVPNDLVAAPAWMPRQATYSRLSKMLQSKLAITEDAADWAVVAWASALDLDSPPKSTAWSWLPGQARTTTTPTGRKSRGKKRQNPVSSVQSNKQSVQKARDRGARAELGWGFPPIDLTNFNVARLHQFAASPSFWANVLPWAALGSATLFLLAVVYWTSTRADFGIFGGTTDGGVGNLSEISTQNGNGGTSGQSLNAGALTPFPFAATGTPLPTLPQLPSAYVSQVMPLPTWANVSVAEGPLLIRQAPSTESPFLSVLQNGDPVLVIGFSDDGRWSQIDSPQAGWVSNDFLLFISEGATHSSVRLSVQILRARYATKVLTAPTANASEVASIAGDDLVIVAATLGQPVQWYQIADPAIGWIAASDLVAVSP